MMSNLGESILKELIREAERSQKDESPQNLLRMYNKMLKALEKLEKIEERLEKIEKKIDWLIDYISFGLYQREIIIKPSTGTGEEKELIIKNLLQRMGDD